MITSGEGRYKVTLDIQHVGSDLLYILRGGEQPHVGGMVLCEIDKEPMVIRLGNHYDHLVLTPLAKTGCEKNHTTVVAIGGIHIDNATKDEIELLQRHCQCIQEQL